MLNPAYRYVGIDFETTGLDTERDCPIQIGIVEINAEGEVIDSFESLIRPTKDVKELRNIVKFITKIETAQLVFAPKSDEIAAQILHFFGPNVIVIGHTIDFDMAFLKRILPEVNYYTSFDTFQFAQALVPYPPSYSLEVLVQHLEHKPLFLDWKSKFGLKFEEEKFHDALYDTNSTLALFCYLVSYLCQIREKYPVLQYFLMKSDVTLVEMLPSSNGSDEVVHKKELPPLKKLAPASTSLVSFPYALDLNTFKDGEKYYVGNLDFKALLTSLLFNKKIMLVFSTKPKLDIAKNILFEMGIKNVGFAREEQTISAEKFQQFLDKETFSQFELYFILKYCSHLFLGYGVLDLNTKGDYMVYTVIKDERQVVKYPVVLTTHHGLYSLLEKEAQVYADFSIVFFDVEWRYRNYNAYLSRTCDLYYIQNFIDMLMYKYESLKKSCNFEKSKYSEKRRVGLPAGRTTEQSGESAMGDTFFVKRDEEGYDLANVILPQFDTFFTMFLGILWTDTKKVFIGRAEDTLQINPITTHPDFYQTNLVLPKLKAFEEPLKAALYEQDFQTLWKQIQHFLEITETIATVQRKMYGQTVVSDAGFYFLFSEEAKFTNWDEFKEIFQKHPLVFLSDHEQHYKKLVDVEGKQRCQFPHVTTLGALEEQLKQGANSVFILSTVKEESRVIFEALQKMRFLQGYEFLTENITGGAGKNIYKANKKLKKIVVGGYNFLMMCYAQQVRFDEILVWNVRGAQSDLILDDVMWYRSQKKLPIEDFAGK